MNYIFFSTINLFIPLDYSLISHKMFIFTLTMIYYLELLKNSSLFIPFWFFTGACIGSFLNVVGYRTPIIMKNHWLAEIKDFFSDQKIEIPKNYPIIDLSYNLSKPSSTCPYCNTPIPFKYNIPILGWFLLKGKTKCCNNPLNFKYPFFEAICAFGTLYIQFIFPSSLALAYTIFFWMLLAITLTDLDSFIIPDNFNYTLGFLAIFFSILGFLPISHKDMLMGFFFGGVTLHFVRVIGKFLFKKEAMGEADPKLLAAIGLWLGVSSILPILLLSSILGLFIGGGIMFYSRLKNQDAPMMIPFGPYLSIAALLYICFKSSIHQYISPVF